MTELRLEFFINIIAGLFLDEQTPITSVEIDSREVGEGSLFVALVGENSDGHDYVGQAMESGAVAALIDRDLDLPYPVLDLRGDPPDSIPDGPLLLRVESSVGALQDVARAWGKRFDVRIIGITGSVGKTTTKELVAEVLQEGFTILKSEKSYNNEIGIPLTVLRLRDEHELAILEMSMYVKGEIELLCGIAPPQVGVLTIIAPVHLERAGSMQVIIDAKAELVEALPSDGVAILNLDDENVMSLADRTQARVLTYGLSPEADIYADGIESLGLEGIRFWLHYDGERRLVKLPILGRHSVHTAMRAAAVGFVEGMGWAQIIIGLQTSQSQLRLLAVKGPNGSVLLDDTYNASPPSTIAALNLLNDLIDGRRIAVLGDMLELGSYEEMGHQLVGIRAAAVASILVTVGERAKTIAAEARRAGMPSESIHVMETAETASAYLLETIKAGDTVLVKGSRAVGMEQIVSALQVRDDG